MLNEPAPEFRLPDLTGQLHSLRATAAAHRVTVVNFWATWCAPCVREMPLIDRFHREYAPRGWQVLGLAVDRPGPVAEYLQRVKVGFPIGLAGLDGMDLLHALGNPQGGLPFTVVVSAGGQLVQRKMGETNFDEMAGWAAKI
jgi:thiol-disulfide isomerase/thioredoxin